MARSAISTATVNTVVASLLALCALALAVAPRFLLSRVFPPAHAAPAELEGLEALLERASPPLQPAHAASPHAAPGVLLARLLACALLGICSGAVFARDALLLSRTLACFLAPSALLLAGHVVALQAERSPLLSQWLTACMATAVAAVFMVVHAFINSE